jgi:hypothetical protein
VHPSQSNSELTLRRICRSHISNIFQQNASEREQTLALTLTELFLAHFLREPLQARHDELHDLVLEHLVLLRVVLQHARELVPLPDLLEQVEEPCELLLCGRLPHAARLLLLLSEHLHERGEVRVEVARLGGAEVRVEQVLRRAREDFEHGRAGLEEVRAKERRVVQQENRAEGGTPLHPRERRKAGDQSGHDVIFIVSWG